VTEKRKRLALLLYYPGNDRGQNMSCPFIFHPFLSLGYEKQEQSKSIKAAIGHQFQSLFIVFDCAVNTKRALFFGLEFSLQTHTHLIILSYGQQRAELNYTKDAAQPDRVEGLLRTPLQAATVRLM
jgi:hypothetical protein